MCIMLQVPKIFTITGKMVPVIISKDCFEKKPAFFTENFIKFNIANNNNAYEYRE